MVAYTEKQFKSILNVRKFIDGWFWDKYGINGYNGCMHGCIYCDSRNSKYGLPEDFSNIIIVKTNVKEQLDNRITKARKLLPDVVGLSGASDPYHPAEARYKNTKQCLEVLEKHKWPVHIITKSDLILRDLEILHSIAKNNWCTVSFTVTTTNKSTSAFLEPSVISPEKRLQTVYEIKRKHPEIQAGVLLIPIVPFLGDTDKDLSDMVKAVKSSGADYMLFGGGMSMNDKQALYFLQHLNQSYPNLIEQYEKLYGFRYDPGNYDGNYGAKRSYNIRISRKLIQFCESAGLRYRIKRYIPDDYRQVNYIIAEKLLNRSFKLQMTGKAWSNMHWAGMNIQNQKESLAEVAKRGELQTIRNVDPDIADFIMEELKEQV